MYNKHRIYKHILLYKYNNYINIIYNTYILLYKYNNYINIIYNTYIYYYINIIII